MLSLDMNTFKSQRPIFGQSNRQEAGIHKHVFGEYAASLVLLL